MSINLRLTASDQREKVAKTGFPQISHVSKKPRTHFYNFEYINENWKRLIQCNVYVQIIILKILDKKFTL